MPYSDCWFQLNQFLSTLLFRWCQSSTQRLAFLLMWGMLLWKIWNCIRIDALLLLWCTNFAYCNNSERTADWRCPTHLFHKLNACTNVACARLLPLLSLETGNSENTLNHAPCVARLPCSPRALWALCSPHEGHDSVCLLSHTCSPTL